MRLLSIFVLVVSSVSLLHAGEAKFDSGKDFISLHYDHAPDKDDAHSAAADRSMLEVLYGREWLKKHVVAVSGTYGEKNAKGFNPKSDAVMDAVWNECGGWLDGHKQRKDTTEEIAKRWLPVLNAGGDVWVKEGGQADITAEVIRALKKRNPSIDYKKRVHVVQHSHWNENKSGDDALAYCKKETDYIRIKDANAYLNQKKGNAAFEKAALEHPVFGGSWKAAFAYYKPSERLDFSDTGELMHILGLGEIGIGQFRERFLESKDK